MHQKHHHHHQTYQLLLKQHKQHKKSHSNYQPSTNPNNIFSEHLPAYVGQDQITRPVGGPSLIEKIQQKLKKQQKNRVKSLQSREMVLPRTILKHILKTEVSKYTDKQRHSKTIDSHTDPHQQTFKQHGIHSKRSLSLLESRKSYKTQVKIAKQKGIDRQTRNYLQKSAILDEITYNQPLHLQQGEKYFEMILRDRWKEEVRKTPFVYHRGHNTSFNNYITKLKKQKPQIRERIRMVLKGRCPTSSQIA